MLVTTESSTKVPRKVTGEHTAPDPYRINITTEPNTTVPCTVNTGEHISTRQTRIQYKVNTEPDTMMSHRVTMMSHRVTKW